MEGSRRIMERRTAKGWVVKSGVSWRLSRGLTCDGGAGGLWEGRDGIGGLRTGGQEAVKRDGRDGD